MDEVANRLRDRLSVAAKRRSLARGTGDHGAWIRASIECARIHFELGDADLGFARKLYAEAAKLIQEHDVEKAQLPEVLGMIGRTMQRMKRWDEVLDWYRKATEAAIAINSPREELRWQAKGASTLDAMNRSDDAVKALEATIARGREMLAAGAAVGDLLAEQLDRLASTGKTSEERAAELWAEADELFAAVPPNELHFHHALNRTAFYTNKDQVRVAQTYLEEAAEIAATIGSNEKTSCDLELRIATLLRKRNEAIQAGERLTAHAPRCASARARHEVLTAALDHFFAGRAWERMLAVGESLRDLRADMAPGWRYDLEMRISIAHRELGQYDAALRCLDDASKLAEMWGHPEGPIKVRAQRSLVLGDLKRFDECVRLSEELRDEGMRSELATRTFVRALIGLGELDRAEALVAEFETDDTDEPAALRLRAYLADAGRGDPVAAWNAVATRARGTMRIEALGRLIVLEPEEAAKHARMRLRLIDYARESVNDVFSEESWRAAYHNAQEFPLWLDDFVERSTTDHEATAFELERFRAQTLVNYLAEREALWHKNEIARGWFKNLAQIDARRAAYRFEALRVRGASWRERREAALRVEELNSRALTADGLIHMSPAEQGLYFPNDLAELVGDTRMTSEEWLVFAHALRDQVVVWAMSGGKAKRWSLAHFTREVIDEIHGTVQGIGRGQRLDLAPILAKLDEVWANPMISQLAEIGAKRVFLSAGTQMTALPLDACASFMAPEAPELVMLPTAKVLGFARQTRKPLPDNLFVVTQEDRDRYSRDRMKSVRGRALVIIDPSRDLDYAPLEGALVASVYANAEIVDSPAVEMATLADGCGRADIVHFTGHGEFDSANPYRSGLSLGKRADRLWTNGDIFSDVDAVAGRLAALSGCSTGQTKPNLLSEEISLPAAFLAAGFSVVVASRWAVDDLAATLLMANFHRRWVAGGITVAAALRASQTWLRELRVADVEKLVATLAKTAADALPARKKDIERICRAAKERLAEEVDQPFADPRAWAAFAVSGDGAITADGIDARIPT